MKYEKEGDLHWQWYYRTGEEHNYKKFVDDSLVPFKNAPKGTIVDIGAGDGLVADLLHKQGFKVFGVEPMQRGVEEAMKHHVRCEYFIEMAEKFATRNLTFDYLYSLCTIEHLDDPRCMLDIMKNIRNFGVIVTDLCDLSIDKKRSKYHTTEFDPKSFMELFKDYDLEALPIRVNGYFGFIIKHKIK